jgi:polyhydroxyalkanoate synthase
VDRWLHAWQNRFTGGRSPSTVALAYLDWAAHAANAPFQTAELARSAVGQWRRLLRVALGQEARVAPPPGDRRFAAPAWQQRPFDLLTQAVLLGEAWWNDVVDNPAGVNPRHRRIVRFTVRQWLDMISPSNVPWLNPEVIEAAQASGGRNFVNGLINLLHD